MCYVYNQWYDISCATLYVCVCVCVCVCILPYDYRLAYIRSFYEVFVFPSQRTYSFVL